MVENAPVSDQGARHIIAQYLKGFAPDHAQDYDPHVDTRWGRREGGA